MTRRKALLALLLVFAFVAHDGWMAHAGHIVYAATADDAPTMGGTAHAKHHDISTDRVNGRPAGMTIALPAMPMTMTCATIRAGTLGQPTSVPEPAGSMAVLPILSDGPDRTEERSLAAWAPPGQPPDVRRAFLQVYRE